MTSVPIHKLIIALTVLQLRHDLQALICPLKLRARMNVKQCYAKVAGNGRVSAQPLPLADAIFLVS